MKDELKRYLYLLALGVAGVLVASIYLEFAQRPAPGGASKVEVSPTDLQDTGFRLPLADGGVLSSEELRGKPLILNFWASWCDACKGERGELEKLKAFAGDRILGIGTQDDKDKLVAYDRAHPHGYRILIDDTGDVAARFKVTGLPHTFLLGPDGQVLARVVGALRPADVDELRRLFDARQN